jgi:hypothetical protein
MIVRLDATRRAQERDTRKGLRVVGVAGADQA